MLCYARFKEPVPSFQTSVRLWRIHQRENMFYSKSFTNLLHFFVFKLQSIIHEYPTASPEDTIDIVSVGLTNRFAFLFLIGTAMVNPVSISIAVNTYLFPLLLGRCIGPTRSMHMSHFAYTCKMRYPLNLVLENSKYLWFY